MEDDGFILLFEVQEGVDEGIDVMSLDWAIVADAEVFEEDVFREEVLGSLFNFMGELADA